MREEREGKSVNVGDKAEQNEEEEEEGDEETQRKENQET